jgi:hypothetical protein
MSWLSIGVGAFVVMVYALLHCSLTTQQALIIIGLSLVSTIGVFTWLCRAMLFRLQLLRGNLEALTAQSNARVTILKELQARTKEGPDQL